jgi:hypothetical protein
MSSYPQYPQPIIRQASSGQNWFLEVTAAGVLQATGTTLDAPTVDPRLTLVSTDRTQAYRFGLDASVLPLVTMTAMPTAAFGGYEDLFVFSPNGREWAVQVNNAGALTVRTMGSSWNVQAIASPGLIDPASNVWALSVADPGIYAVDGPQSGAGLNPLGAITVRSEDNTTAWTVTVDANGILSVAQVDLATAPQMFGFVLTAPGGNVYVLTVDSAGILYIDTALQDAINARDEWTVVFAKNNTIFYVVDERFRPPVPGFGGRYGWRSRRF